MNIAAIITLILLFIFPLISLCLFVLILYFIYAQFKSLWLHKPLRRIGFDCFYLAYSIDAEVGNYVGRSLLLDRDNYRKDYVSLGFQSFHDHASELVELDNKFKKLLSDNEIYENCYN